MLNTVIDSRGQSQRIKVKGQSVLPMVVWIPYPEWLNRAFKGLSAAVDTMY